MSKSAPVQAGSAEAGLRDAIREAHAATRDLKVLLGELRAERKAAEAVLREGLTTAASEVLGPVVSVLLEHLANVVIDQMHKSEAAIEAKFQDLFEQLTGTDSKSRRQGRPSLEVLLQSYMLLPEEDQREVLADLRKEMARAVDVAYAANKQGTEKEK